MTITDQINKELNRLHDLNWKITDIQIPSAALKIFIKQWIPESELDSLDDPKFERVGEVVGSYRGFPVSVGESSYIKFLCESIVLSRIVLEKEFVVELEAVFSKLKEVLGLDSDVDELDVLIEVARLKAQPAKNNFLPHTIGTGIRDIKYPNPIQPTITYNDSTDFNDSKYDKIPQHLLKRAAAVRSKMGDIKDSYELDN